MIWKPAKKLGIIMGFDIGAEQKSKGSTDYNIWYAPVLILKNELSPSSALSLRAEYYTDPGGVIINTETGETFHTLGYSVNYDLTLRESVLFRLEGRKLQSQNRVFIREGSAVHDDVFLTTALIFSF